MQDIAVGPDGALYACSWGTSSVKRYDLGTGRYLGDFIPSGYGGLNRPDDVDFAHDGLAYVSSRFDGSIRRYDAVSGLYVDRFIHDDRLGGFTGFAIGPDHDICAGMYTPFGGPQNVLRFDGRTGGFVSVFTRNHPNRDSAFLKVEFGPDSDLYTTRIHSDLVERDDGGTGEYLGDFVSAGSGGLDAPTFFAFRPDGKFFVRSHYDRVLQYDGETGAFEGAFVQGVPFTNAVVFVPEPAAALMLLAALPAVARRARR